MLDRAANEVTDTMTQTNEAMSALNSAETQNHQVGPSQWNHSGRPTINLRGAGVFGSTTATDLKKKKFHQLN